MMKLLLHTLLGFLMCGVTSCAKKPSPFVASTALPFNGQIAFCGREENSERYDIYFLDLAKREWRNLTEEYAFQIDDSFGHSIGCDDYMHPYRVTGLA